MTNDIHDIPSYSSLPGHVGNFTEEQQAALDKLKVELRALSSVSETRLTDEWLSRFLRARKWNVNAAKQMFLDAEKWRKEFGVDDLAREFTFDEGSEVSKIFPQYFHKIDKDGRPVYIERIGKVNMSKLRAITTEDRMLKAYVLACEMFYSQRLPACSRLMGRPVTNVCTILDLDGVVSGLSLFWDAKSYIQQTSHIGQNYYPEGLGKMYIVNVPWVFATIWRVICGWLDPVTAAKVVILSGNGRKEL